MPESAEEADAVALGSVDEKAQMVLFVTILLMTTSSMIGVLFLGIAVIFFAIALRESIHRERGVAQRVRLRVGIIFTLVGVGLQVVHWLLGY